MPDDDTQPVAERIAKAAEVVEDGVKNAAERIGTTIEQGRKPGQPLDILAKITREAPLGALLVAFLAGAMLARRR